MPSSDAAIGRGGSSGAGRGAHGAGSGRGMEGVRRGGGENNGNGGTGRGASARQRQPRQHPPRHRRAGCGGAPTAGKRQLGGRLRPPQGGGWAMPPAGLGMSRAASRRPGPPPAPPGLPPPAERRCRGRLKAPRIGILPSCPASGTLTSRRGGGRWRWEGWFVGGGGAPHLHRTKAEGAAGARRRRAAPPRSAAGHVTWGGAARAAPPQPRAA